MKKIFTIAFIGVLSVSVYAKSDCDDKVFSNLSASKGTTISQMLEQLSSRCSFSIAVKDNNAEELLNKQLNTINLRDFTLNDIFDFLLTENKLDYEYQNGILKISSYTTKTFKVDYITAVRSAATTFNPSGGASTSGNTTATTSGQPGLPSSSSSGSTFQADDKDIKFWDKIRTDIASILNPNIKSIEHRIEWKSEAERASMLGQNATSSNQTRTEAVEEKTNDIIINPQAGLITVTATKSKLKEIQKYLENVLDRLHRQVFIDVQILSVTLNKTNTTGIDWSKMYSALGAKVSYGSLTTVNTPTIDTTSGVITQAAVGTGGLAQYFRLNGGVDLTDFIKFLRTQGDVKAISNPKIMTLNNQPALINSGDVIFYPKVSGGTSATATTGATNPTVETIPLNVGITLDITPEIMDDANILLKINPTSSSCIATNCPLQTVKVAGTDYNIAPNIALKQISSVVKINDGDRIILGGLIKDSSGTDTKKVPLLGDIPMLGYLFKQEVESKTMEEMVIVITPHIIKKEKPLTLKELGYKSDLDK